MQVDKDAESASATIRITGIPEEDWSGLRDRLALLGWTVSRGGGLDHSWATLQKGDLRIDMAYDRWVEGEISFPAVSSALIHDELPKSFARVYEVHTVVCDENS